MDADLNILATALYACSDHPLKSFPERVPCRPAVGIAPRVSDAEMVTPAVMQALLGHTSEAGWAEYGYHASHSRFFWGLRLHLVATPHGLPIGWRSPAPRPTNATSCSTCSTTTPPGPLPDRGKSCSRTRTTRAASSRRSSTPSRDNSIWHNDHTGQRVKRSMLAYGH